MRTIHYKNELNSAQYEAVTTLDGPVLVIAGAGSGKTRTVVYRLANMVESGIPASRILLLTFTRKAAQEMLRRAGILLGYEIGGVQGGTFHSLAYSILRRHPGPDRPASFSLMDAGDMGHAIRECREALRIAHGDRSFPRVQTTVSLISKARNKECGLEEIIRREAYHLLPHAEALDGLSHAYASYKKERALMDYDDLLFGLEKALETDKTLLVEMRRRYSHIMVDEYQDTNRVQARIIRLLGGERGNVMAVGDDAQSIYAFRGADIRNILDFPTHFADTKIIKLEENYRSTQPVLDLANAVLEKAPEAWRKNLYTTVPGGGRPELVRPLTNRTQSELVVRKIEELRLECPLREISVLFRASYQSYEVEMALRQAAIPFRKYGGMKFSEAAHIKDVISFLRLTANPRDELSFQRVVALVKGVGPKTAKKIYEAFLTGEEALIKKACGRHARALSLLSFIREQQGSRLAPARLFRAVLQCYQPFLEELYPDDYPYRAQGLEELARIAAEYTDMALFLADFSLDEPQLEGADDEEAVTLSTVHSAKGLEWDAVLILDLVEDRFPSRHAMESEEEYEEERRLLYVALTRARKHISLFVPRTVYSRQTQCAERTSPSPFVRELAPELYAEFQECPGGQLARRDPRDISASARLRSALATGAFSLGEPPANAPGDFPPASDSFPPSLSVGEEKASAQNPLSKPDPSQCGYCRHRIFGRGKIVERLGNDKSRVNFPNFGLKVIMNAYLETDDI